MQTIKTHAAARPRARGFLRAAELLALALALSGCISLPGLAPEPAPAPAPPPEPVAPAPAAPEPAPAPAPDRWRSFLGALESAARAEVPVALVRGSNDTVLLRASGPTLWDAKGAPSVAFKRFLVRFSAAVATLDGASIAIEGHTDASGPRESNLATSRARAQSVLKQLAANGIAPARLHAGGQGARVPVASNASPAGRAANSRIDIVVTRGDARAALAPSFAPHDPPSSAARGAAASAASGPSAPSAPSAPRAANTPAAARGAR